MKTFAALALAGVAAAAPRNHAIFHEKKGLLDGLDSLTSDLTNLLSAGQNLLSQLNVKQAINSNEPTQDTWLGEAQSGNAVVNTIVNKSGKDATWVCWGKAASWLAVTAPRVSVKVPNGQNMTVSHYVSQDQWNPNSGACAVMFEGDGLDHSGQLNQAWMEFSFVNNMYSGSTFDLSMEVNPNGFQHMSIASPKCRSTIDQCSFHCKATDVPFCGQFGDYYLKNCAPGSQQAVADGQWGNNAAGGCQGIENTGITKLTTVLGQASS